MPATFQALMNKVFGEQIIEIVFVFFDDILIYIPNLEIHLEHLKEVFDILRKQ